MPESAPLPDPVTLAKAIMDTMPGALLLLHSDLRVHAANQTFYEMFGLQPTQVEGRIVYELGNGQWNIPELRTLLEDILPENNMFTGYEVDHVFGTLGRRILLLNGRRLHDVQRILLIITDMTAQRETEQVLRQTMRITQFRMSLSDALRPLTRPDEVQSVAGRLLNEYLGASRTQYAEVADGKYITVDIDDSITADNLPSVPRAVEGYQLDDYGATLVQTLQAGQTVVVSNVEEDTRLSVAEKASTVALQVCAYILVPLVKQHQLVAILAAHSTHARAWTADEIAVIEETAERTWEAVERARVETALRRNEERYTFLVRLGDAKRSQADAEKIKVVATRILGEHLHADQVEYYEAKANFAADNGQAGSNTSDRFTDIAQPHDVEFTPWMLDELRAGHPVVVHDTGKLTEASASQHAAFVLFPLMQTDQLVAVLGVFQATPRYWTEEELSLIQETAERTCSAIERARAIAALQTTTERLRSAQDASGVGTFEWDIQNDVNHWSPEIERLYGLATGSFRGTYEDWAALIHPEDLPEAERLVRLALETGRFSAEWRIVRPNGENVWLLGRAWVEKDAQGRPRRMIGANVDITRRKRAEEALRASEQRYRTLFNSIDESFSVAEMIYDGEGKPVDFRYLETNPAFESVTGIQEATGKTARELVPNLEQQWIELFDNVATSGIAQRVARQVQRTGKWYETYVFPIGNPEERRVAILGKDITAQKQTEDGLRQLNEILEQRVDDRTKQVRRLVTQLTMSEQAERRRISQFLHDDLQQHIFGLQFQLKILRDAIAGMQMQTAHNKLNEMNDIILRIVGMTRSLSVELSPPILHHEGLTEAISWLATQLRQQHGLKVEVHSTGSTIIPGEDLRVLLFQIVRELLFNVVKHASVDEATVSLSRIDGRVRVEVSDPGRGFAVEEVLGESSRSHGILQNQQRLELVGGRMQIESMPQMGTRIVIECPVPDSV